MKDTQGGEVLLRDERGTGQSAKNMHNLCHYD